MAKQRQLTIVAVLDDFTCDRCRARDGEVVDADSLADYPERSCDNAATDTGICRCKLRPVEAPAPAIRRAYCPECGAELTWPRDQAEPWPCGLCAGEVPDGG